MQPETYKLDLGENFSKLKLPIVKFVKQSSKYVKLFSAQVLAYSWPILAGFSIVFYCTSN